MKSKENNNNQDKILDLKLRRQYTNCKDYSQSSTFDQYKNLPKMQAFVTPNNTASVICEALLCCLIVAI
jgi:hypothetical protein